MKKLTSLIVVLALMTTLASCTNKPSDTTTVALTTTTATLATTVASYISQQALPEETYVKYLRQYWASKAEGNLLPIETLVALSRWGDGFYPNDVSNYNHVDFGSGVSWSTFFMDNGFAFTLWMPGMSKIGDFCFLNYYDFGAGILYSVRGVDHIEDFVTFINNDILSKG